MIIISQDGFRLIRDPRHIYADVNGGIRVKVGSDDILIGNYTIERSGDIIERIASDMVLESLSHELIFQMPDF